MQTVSLNDSWEAKAGDCYFSQVGNKEHLFIVLFEPDFYPNEGYGKRACIVSVNITSVSQYKAIDEACIIEVGEHEFIKHTSYIYYEKIQFVDYEHVKQCVNSGVYRKATPVSATLLDKIIAGIFTSSFIPRKFKVIFKDK